MLLDKIWKFNLVVKHDHLKQIIGLSHDNKHNHNVNVEITGAEDKHLPSTFQSSSSFHDNHFQLINQSFQLLSTSPETTINSSSNQIVQQLLSRLKRNGISVLTILLSI